MVIQFPLKKTMITMPATMRYKTTAFCKQVDHPDPISQTFLHLLQTHKTELLVTSRTGLTANSSSK